MNNETVQIWNNTLNVILEQWIFIAMKTFGAYHKNSTFLDILTIIDSFKDFITFRIVMFYCVEVALNSAKQAKRQVNNMQDAVFQLRTFICMCA